MKLTDKYRPTSIEEFVGDTGTLLELEQYVLSSYPTILVGPPGIGKTCSAYIVANKLGLTVIESNASNERTKADLKKLKSMLSNKTFEPVLYLLDEIDGLRNQDFLATILRDSNRPIIMTANDKQKLSVKLKKASKVIPVPIPFIKDVVLHIKLIAEKENINVTDYSKVTTDIRSSINNIFNGGENYISSINDFEKVDRIFRGKLQTDISPIWLIDNVHLYYTGRRLLEAIEVIRIYALTGKKEVFSALPVATRGKAVFPHFFRRQRWH